MQIQVKHRLELYDSHNTVEHEAKPLILPMREAHAVMGETVAAYLDRVAWRFDLPTVCIVNDRYYGRAEWSALSLGLNDNVQFVSRPLGGGGSTGSTIKSVVAVVALIALTAVAPQLGALGAGAMLGLGGAATGTLATVLSAAIVGAGALAISYFLSPKAGGKSKETDPLYSFGLQGNQAKPMQPIPVLNGRVKFGPEYAAPTYSEYDGDGMIDYALFCLTCGRMDVEKVLIGDTELWDKVTGYSPDYPGVTLQIVEPGDQVTLYPVNVVTADELQGVELTTSWSQPFIPAPAGTNTVQVLIDLVWPGGAYHTSEKGKTIRADTHVLLRSRPIDDAGAPIGDWVERFGKIYSNNKNSQIRLTEHLDWPGGRHEYAMRRVNEPTASDNGTDAVTWAALRAHIDGPQSFPRVTTMAVKGVASKQLSGVNGGQLKVIGTRILPVWENGGFVEKPTRSIAWAALDWWRNSYYSAGLNLVDLDFQQFINLDALWASLGHTFDFRFSEVQNLDEVLETVLKAGRAFPAPVGDKLTITRDQPRGLSRMLFTENDIVAGTLELDYALSDEAWADGMIGEYLDERTWRLAEVSSAPDGVQLLKPARVKLEGIVDRKQATGAIRFIAAESQYRRIAASWTSRSEGKLLKRGDLVKLTADEPETWGQSCEIVGVSNGGFNLRLDPPPVWADSPSHYIEIRRRDGRPWGPVRVSRGATVDAVVLNGDDVASVAAKQGYTLSEAVARKRTQEPPWAAFSPGSPRTFPVLITEGDPDQDGEHIHLKGVVDASEVYDTNENGVPLLPIVPDLYSNTLPIILSLFANISQRQLTLVLTAGWQGAQNALTYEAGVSYDNTTWIEAYRGDRTTFEAVVGASASMSVRVRGISPSGVPGGWFVVPVAVPDLIVDNSKVTLIEINYEDLVNDAKAKLDHVLEVEKYAQNVAEQAQKDFAAALARAEEVQDYAEGVAAQARADFAAALARAEEVQDYAESVASQARADFAAALARAEEVQDYAEGVAAQARADFADAAGRADAAGAVASSALSNALQALRDAATASAQVVAEATARYNADEATTYTLNGAISRIGTAEAAIVTEATTRATADEASVKRVDGISTRVGNNESSITSLETSTADRFTAQATKIDKVEAKVDTNTASIVTEAKARSDEDGSLSTRIDSVKAESASNTAAIITEQTARADAVSSLATDVSYVNSVAQGNTALISTERTARSDADGALGRRIDTVQTLADGNAASIVEERTTRVTDVSAVATYLNNVAARTEGAYSAISTEAVARNDQDTSLSKRIDSVTATASNNSAAIIAEQTARADEDYSLAQSVLYVNAVAQGNVGAISSEATARADADGALGRRVDTVQSLADGNSAAIVEERTARVTDVSAVATYLNTVAVRTEGAYSAISSESVARNDQDTSLSRRIDSVTATAGDNSAAIISERTARSNDVSSLSQSIEYVNSVAQGNVGAISSEATTRADADGALGRRVDTVQSLADGNSAAIVEERTTRANDVSAVATYLNNVAVRTEGAYSSISAEAVARNDQDTSLSQRIDSVTATSGNNTAAIINEQTARSNDVSSLSQSIEYVNSVAQGNVGAISSERTARSDADGALATRIDTVQSKTDSNAALIVEERTARTTDVSAVATYLNSVAVRTEAAHSAVQSEAVTRYNADGALGSRIDSVTSTTNSNTAAIISEQTARSNDVSSLASSINYVSAKTDKGTATGRFTLNATSGPSGVTARLEALLATSEGGQTRGAGYYLDLLDNGQSRFVIDANAFYITSGGSNFPLLTFDSGTQTLQVPNLRVTSQAFLPDSISKSEFVATGDSSEASYTLTTGPNAKILIIASYDGQPGRSIPGSNGAGILRISRDGNAIRDVYVNYYLAGNNDNRGSFLLQTTALMKDTPTPGQHTYTVSTTLGLTGVNILVLALAA